MANVSVIQRHAHLAGAVEIEFVNGREGRLAKAVLTATSNPRRGSGETREAEPTAVRWTLWGKPAENAAEYLGVSDMAFSSAQPPTPNKAAVPTTSVNLRVTPRRYHAPGTDA